MQLPARPSLPAQTFAPAQPLHTLPGRADASAEGAATSVRLISAARCGAGLCAAVGCSWALRRQRRRAATRRRAQQGWKRRQENVDGNFFVDDKCIDCDTCRWMAPKTFGFAGPQSAVLEQPTEAETKRAALRALVACPTHSIRTESPAKELSTLLKDPDFLAEPIPSLPGAFHLGMHSHRSFGAVPYLLVLPGEERVGILVDAPRFSSKLLHVVLDLCQPKYMVLSHVDDVGDHQKWRDKLPELRRVMHTKEIYGPGNWLNDRDLESCEVQLQGTGPWDLEGADLASVDGSTLWLSHVPGHSHGSIALCYRPSAGSFEGSAIFTGDSLAMSGRTGGPTGFPRYNSGGRGLQADTLRKLPAAAGEFEWVLPGHGRRHRCGSRDEFSTFVQAAAEEMDRS